MSLRDLIMSASGASSGPTWTFATTLIDPTTSFKVGLKLKFVNFKYFAFGQGCSIYYSTDAINWTYTKSYYNVVASNQTLTSCTNINWDGSKYLAGKGSYAKFANSTDGITWTGQTDPWNVSDGRGLWFGGGKSLTFGVGGWVKYSTNSLVSWIDEGLVLRNQSYIDIPIDAYHNGSMWIGVSYSGRIITSTDGVTWVVRADSPTGNCALVRWGNNKWLIVETNNTISISTDNGVNFVNGTAPFAAGELIRVLEHNGSYWLAGTNTGKLATSPDGITWTSRNWLSDLAAWNNQGIVSLVWGNNKWTVTGSQGGIANSTTLTQ